MMTHDTCDACEKHILHNSTPRVNVRNADAMMLICPKCRKRYFRNCADCGWTVHLTGTRLIHFNGSKRRRRVCFDCYLDRKVALQCRTGCMDAAWFDNGSRV